MLEERLKNASQEASSQRLKSTLKISAVAVGTVSLLVSLSFFWQGSSPTTAPVPSASKEEDASASHQDQVGREDFKEALKAFENDIEPHVSTDPFLKWNSNAQHQIFSGKDKSISLFSAGDYALAMAELGDATRLAQSEIQLMNTAFDDAMARAQRYYDQDIFDQAKIEITKAQNIRPGDQGVLTLEARINALPRVLELIKSADIARAENDLKGEASNLQLILALAPNRANVKERLTEVSLLLKEQQFSAHINAGMSHITAQNLPAAKRDLNGAKSIFPERAEVSLLSAEVQKLAKTLRVQNLLRKASAAVEEDDWATASKLYAEASAVEPNNAKVAKGRATAQAILSLHGKIDGHLMNSHRLGSPAVIRDVQSILGDSINYHAQSLALSLKASELEAKLKAYGKKVPLLIRSDNQTHIIVRGVGKVGQIIERYIELKPGTYTLEGIRPGYKSRLVSVSIEPNAKDIVVEVVCNERL